MLASERIRQYDLLGELAVGGMATVYIGRDHDDERLVAIKSMRQDLAGDDAFLAMFLDEATLTSRIKHPNVVETLDVVSADGRLLIVMEYVEGVSLGKLLEHVMAAGKTVPPAIAVRILCDVLRGLHAAHELVDEHGKPLAVVHRDVSPQNVIVGVDGRARLLDFGIAKAATQNHVTAFGEIKGKLAYMPPEQQLAEKVDRRSDVYAAGVVLWELLAGRRLFDAQNEAALVEQVFEGRIEPPSFYADDALPAEVDRIALRAVARSAGDRWPTTDEMANALEASLPPASKAELAAFVLTFGHEEVDERRGHIQQMTVADASHLDPEARIVLDALAAAHRYRTQAAESDPDGYVSTTIRVVSPVAAFAGKTVPQPFTPPSGHPSAMPAYPPVPAAGGTSAMPPVGPSGSYPSIPSARRPSVPSAQHPSVPDARYPSVPDARYSSVPDARYPSAPDTRVPSGALATAPMPFRSTPASGVHAFQGIPTSRRAAPTAGGTSAPPPRRPVRARASLGTLVLYGFFGVLIGLFTLFLLSLGLSHHASRGTTPDSHTKGDTRGK